MTTESVEPSPADAPPAAVPPVPPPAAPGVPEAPAVPPAPPVVPAVPPLPEAVAPEAVAPDTAQDAAPDAALPVGAALPADAVPPVRAPRRPRPVLLLVSALLLGTVVGGAVGYAIQANRPPTPLPPIQVALPSYPAEAADPAAVAAEAPKALAIDGDLRKLLMTAPDGSTAWADYPDRPSWITVGELAGHSGSSASLFKALNSKDFRRAVEVDWKKDDLKVRVTLIQYAADRAAEAKSRAAGYHLTPFAEGANGGYQVDTQAEYWAETTEQFYYGSALAQRGTVVMDVEVFGTKPVNPDVVKDIAKQQWERLV
ncbi:hypothetical protein [Kitasatospora sp. NPDC092286]|uniref:hypothetical protein n=1 Tax=Kitasatospora sp. NPDC092286 TaxID=3364087 RepID=UPI00381B1DF3